MITIVLGGKSTSLALLVLGYTFRQITGYANIKNSAVCIAHDIYSILLSVSHERNKRAMY
ncbi:MAG TPA: hypothetical protein VEX65_03470 [Flavisolibacter sp.]|nr:hypothetical protein [Flavisolibacter sp.]